MKPHEEFMNRFHVDPPDGLSEALKLRLAFRSCLVNKEHHRVYLVEESGEKCILKITEPGAANNLKREQELLSKLNHPGIPKPLDFETDESGRDYLLRTYAPGDTLKSLLERDGAFSPRQTMEIAHKLCEILAYLHKQIPPVIYRDITPDNVVITPNGRLSLMDFGISREVYPDKDFDTIYVGNTAFAPPEQFGFTRTDTRSDIFAVGKLMIYLATGATDLQSYRVKLSHPGLRKIIARCTRLSPEKRYRSVIQLRRVLERHLNPPTRKEFLLAGACAVLVAVSGVFVAFKTLMPAPDALPASTTPVSATGDSHADQVKIPVLIEVSWNGKPFSDCAVAVDNHHWYEPAANGKAELLVYAHETYNIRAVSGNRTALQAAAVTRQMENVSFCFDLALTPEAPAHLPLEFAVGQAEEFPLPAVNADSVTLSGAPEGVVAVHQDNGFYLVMETTVLPGYYTIFAEWENEFGRADTVIGLHLTEEKEPVVIRTAQELDNIRNDLTGSYILAGNIDLSDFESWTPIGTEAYPFTGVFDGAGYEINNLRIFGSDTVDVGLFGACERAVIRKVILREPQIRYYNVENRGVAALAGSMNKGLIERCAIFEGNVTAQVSFYAAAGGICGESRGSIMDCFNSADITLQDKTETGTDTIAGGICGMNYGYVENCGNTGGVSAHVLAGGVTGFNDMGIVTCCYNAGLVRAPAYNGAYYPGGIAHLLGRGKRISYCAFEAGSAPFGATVWNGGTLLCLMPFDAEEMRDLERLQSAFSGSGLESEWVISAESEYPIPAGIPILH